MVSHGRLVAVRGTAALVALALLTLCLGGVAQAAMPTAHGACQGLACEMGIGCTGSANAQAAPLPPAMPIVALVPRDELPVPAPSPTILTVGRAQAPPDRPASPPAPRSPPVA